MGRSLLGALLILLGAGFLLQQFEVFQFGNVFATWWPMILILLGATQLFAKPPAYTPAIILIGLGAVFQMRTLGYVQVSVFRLIWPLLLIFIGIRIVMNTANRPIPGIEDSYINNFNIFSGYETKVTSSAFKGGSITSVFGGSEIDLREAKLAGEEAFMDITAIFGGSEIRVPSHWIVKADGLPIFGGIDNTTKHEPIEDIPSPKLIIRGLALFGGVDIKN